MTCAYGAWSDRVSVTEHCGGEDQPDGAVEPEDVTPVAEREDHGAVQRTHDAAELLDGSHDAQGESAALGRPHVGHQSQCRRDQPATTNALGEAARDDRLEVVGGGRDE